jgi:hypothetical protein
MKNCELYVRMFLYRVHGLGKIPFGKLPLCCCVCVFASMLVHTYSSIVKVVQATRPKDDTPAKQHKVGCMYVKRKFLVVTKYRFNVKGSIYVFSA